MPVHGWLLKSTVFHILTLDYYCLWDIKPR
jgi:hypothetical protein